MQQQHSVLRVFTLSDDNYVRRKQLETNDLTLKISKLHYFITLSFSDQFEPRPDPVK